MTAHLLNTRGSLTSWLCQVAKLGANFSVNPRQAHTVQISNASRLQAIEFYKANSDPSDSSTETPIVVLFGWLQAQRRHLEKYSRIYRCMGADVITCRVGVKELLRPSQAERIAREVLDMLMEPKHNERSIIVHGFSVGAYMYGQFLNKLSTFEKYASVKDRIKGHIFDSVVDVHKLSTGVSVAASKHRMAQLPLKLAVDLCLFLTKKYTWNVYHERAALFCKPPIIVPSLLLYSLDDPVADSFDSDTLAETWQSQHIDVYCKVWENSLHAAHMLAHTAEYVEEVVNFIKKLNIFESVPDKEAVISSISSRQSSN